MVDQRARRRRDRHVVVVQDDDQSALLGADVVEPLHGEPARQRAIADDGNHMLLGRIEVARNGEAQSGRQ